MKKQVFKFLAKVNKVVLPSYSKKQLDLAKATKYKCPFKAGIYRIKLRVYYEQGIDFTNDFLECRKLYI